MILCAVIVMGNVQCWGLEWKMSDIAMSDFHKIIWYCSSLMPFWQYYYHSIHHDNMVIVFWYAAPVGIDAWNGGWRARITIFHKCSAEMFRSSNDGPHHNCWYLKFHITVSNQIPQVNLTSEGNLKKTLLPTKSVEILYRSSANLDSF